MRFAVVSVPQMWNQSDRTNQNVVYGWQTQQNW
jgi:hypothetical protein